MSAFRFEKPVRFGDVDHAGIVYYPHFFHYFHVAFEELFGAGAYQRILDEQKIGFPAVHVECDFSRPLRYGDRALIDVSVVRLGDKSATFRYVVRTVDNEDVVCAQAKITCAVVDMQTFSAVSTPAALRRLFDSFKEVEAVVDV